MFSIRKGNTNLSLSKNSKISLEMNSSVFDDELFNGAYSLPVDFELTNPNIKALDFRHIIQNKELLETPIPIYLDIENNPYKEAILRLDFSSNKKISGFIQIDNGSIASDITEVKINNIDLGGERFIGNNYADKLAHFNGKAQMLANVDQYTFFPIYNPNFFGAPDDTLNGQFSADSKVLNKFDSGSFLSNPDVLGVGDRYAYSFVPMVSLVYLIEQCCKAIGYRATGTFLANAEIKSAVIYNTTAIDKMVLSLGQHTNVHQDYINLINHVPEMSIADFFHELRNFFFVDIQTNSSSKTIDFKTLREIHEDEIYVDWSKGALNNFEQKPFNTNGLKFSLGVDDADELFETYSFEREYYSGPTIGDKRDASSSISSLYMKSNPLGLTLHQQLIPEALQVGSSLEPNYNDPLYNENVLGINPYSLRILFYRGKHADSSGSLYPLGSSDVYNYAGAKIANYSLDWLGDYGRKKTFAQKHIDFWLQTKRITVSKMFTQNELENFNPRKKVMINGMKFLVSKLNIDSDFKSKPGKVELYTV